MPTVPAKANTTDARRDLPTTIPTQIKITATTIAKSSRVATPIAKTAASKTTRRDEGAASSSARPAASTIEAMVRNVTKPTSMPRNVQNTNGYVRLTARAANGAAQRLDGTSRAASDAAMRDVAEINTTPASITASAADDPSSPTTCNAAMSIVHNGFD